MTLIRLNDSHRETIHAMRTSAEEWLRKKHLDQWNGERAKEAHGALDKELNANQMVGWIENNHLVAVASIKGPDLDFWTEEEASDPDAAWIGRFMVTEHGNNYGSKLLNAIISQQHKEGKKIIRLDCWRDNKALHRYYENHGFKFIRMVEVPGRMSGALFERLI